MNRMKLVGLVLLLLIGTASGAMYIVTHYQAHLNFERSMPGPEMMSVKTLVECGAGYASDCNIGTMGDNNNLSFTLMHTNMEESTVTGIVMMELECPEYFTQNVNEITRVQISYAPGVDITCTDGSCINRISDTKILINMTDVPRNFYSGSSVLSDVEIEFDPGAYGTFVLTSYVNT